MVPVKRVDRHSEISNKVYGMADQKRKSGWRNWVVNGCFLASGLMIGLKGGQNKQSDAPSPEDPAQVVSNLDNTDSESTAADADDNVDKADRSDKVSTDVASQEDRSRMETDDASIFSAADSESDPVVAADFDFDEQTVATNEKVAEQSIEEESESDSKHETSDNVANTDSAKSDDSSSTQESARQDVKSEAGRDAIVDIASQLRSLTQEEMVVEKRQIDIPVEEKAVVSRSAKRNNEDQVEPDSVTEKPSTDSIAAGAAVGKATTKPVLEENARPEVERKENRFAKQEQRTARKAAARKDAGKIATPNSNPSHDMNSDVVQAKKNKANAAAAKPVYRIETIPAGAAEVIDIRPAVSRDVRPVSATQRAPDRSVSEREEKAKAVKAIENELQRLQRALRELQDSPSQSSSSSRR